MLLTWIIFSPKWQASKATFGQMIIAYVKRAFHLMTGESTAEELKIEIGSNLPPEQELTMENKAREVSEQLPKNLKLRSEPDRETLPESFLQTLEPVRNPLSHCSSADLAVPDLQTESVHAKLSHGVSRRMARALGFCERIGSHCRQSIADGISGGWSESQFLKRVTAGSC